MIQWVIHSIQIFTFWHHPLSLAGPVVYTVNLTGPSSAQTQNYTRLWNHTPLKPVTSFMVPYQSDRLSWWSGCILSQTNWSTLLALGLTRCPGGSCLVTWRRLELLNHIASHLWRTVVQCVTKTNGQKIWKQQMGTTSNESGGCSIKAQVLLIPPCGLHNHCPPSLPKNSKAQEKLHLERLSRYLKASEGGGSGEGGFIRLAAFHHGRLWTRSDCKWWGQAGHGHSSSCGEQQWTQCFSSAQFRHPTAGRGAW